MAIATMSDLKRLLDSQTPSGTPRIEISEEGDITEASCNAFLTGQEGFILAYLGYTPETTGAIGQTAKEIHGKLTAWHIWIHIIDQSAGEGKIPEYVREWYKWAMEMLKMAKAGELDLRPSTTKTPLRAFSSEIRQVRDAEVTMETNDYVKLPYYPVIPNSEVVYSEEHQGGTQYTKDTDYKINYEQAEVMAISGSAITDQQKVYFSYAHLETRKIKKRPERVDYGNRGNAAPNWEGIFG